MTLKIEVFSAAAPSFFTTTGLEAFFKSDKFTPTPGTDRVPIANKIFYYKVQRNLIKLLKAAGDNPLTLGKDNDRVYLTPKPASEVEGASRIYPDADVVLVVTDQFGTPFKFNNVTGEQTEGEKASIAFYDLKRTKDKFDGELLKPDGTLKSGGKAEAMRNSLSQIKGISDAEAQAILEREGKALTEIREYVKDPSKTKPLKFEITGGSLGYIETDFKKLTPLSKIKEVLTFKKGNQISDNDLGSDQERKNKNGKFYVTVDALHGRHIQVEQPGIPDTTNRELILDLLLEQELYEGGRLLSPRDRLQYVQNYLNVISDTSLIKMKVSSDGKSYTLLDEAGNMLDVSDPKSRNYINELMSELKPKGEGDRDYYKLKMNINADRIKQNSIKVPSITENASGQKVITTEQKNYQDFLKENDFKVTTLEVGDDGKLRKTNSYFSFQLTEESQEDLYGTALEESPTAEIDTVEVKEAIESAETEAEELELPEMLDAPQSDEDLLNQLKNDDPTWK
jgi:hypothetical protein